MGTSQCPSPCLHRLLLPLVRALAQLRAVSCSAALHTTAELRISWEATESNLPRESWGNWGSLVWEEVGVPSCFLPGRAESTGRERGFKPWLRTGLSRAILDKYEPGPCPEPYVIGGGGARAAGVFASPQVTMLSTKVETPGVVTQGG